MATIWSSFSGRVLLLPSSASLHRTYRHAEAAIAHTKVVEVAGLCSVGLVRFELACPHIAGDPARSTVEVDPYDEVEKPVIDEDLASSEEEQLSNVTLGLD